MEEKTRPMDTASGTEKTVAAADERNSLTGDAISTSGNGAGAVEELNPAEEEVTDPDGAVSLSVEAITESKNSDSVSPDAWNGAKQWGESVWKDVEAAWRRAEQIKDALAASQGDDAKGEGLWSEGARKWAEAAIRHAEMLQHGAEQMQQEAAKTAEEWGEDARRAVEDYNRDMVERGRHWEERLARWQEGARRWAEESERRRRQVAGELPEDTQRADAPGIETKLTDGSTGAPGIETKATDGSTGAPGIGTKTADGSTAAPDIDEKTADGSTAAPDIDEKKADGSAAAPEVEAKAAGSESKVQRGRTKAADTEQTSAAARESREALEDAQRRAAAARERAEQARKRAKAESREARDAERAAKAAERAAGRETQGGRTDTIEERLEGTAEQVRRKFEGMSRYSYNALVAIVPAVFAVIVYELIVFVVVRFVGAEAVASPLMGLAMLVPMAFMTERFYFTLSAHEAKKVGEISDAIHAISGGDYEVRLDTAKLVPYAEVAGEINEMAQQLGSVETLRRDFINNFSHEFKTPITSISGFAHLLLEEELPAEERQEYLQIIADESDRLASFSSNTMMLSRLETQTEIPDQAPYALDGQIRQAVILLSRQWGEKKIDMDVELDPVTYTGNADLMMHIWVNLLNNAVKFTPENGRISVRLKSADGFASASVSDTGIGMTKEDTERIFQKYYQADTSHASKGMGLGLSIAWRIAELAGGHIDVDSVPGKGSTFTVKLPL